MSKSPRSSASSPAHSNNGYVPRVRGEAVAINVGKSDPFTVHKSVLLQSPYFQNALKPEWTSAREGKPIDLSDQDPSTFEEYVQWLYSHHIDTSTAESVQLAKMYALGETLMHVEFQDAVIEALMTICEERDKYPTGEQINIIYEGTMPNSPARKLLVDFFCWEGGEKWIEGEDFANTKPTEFVNDLMYQLLKNRRTPKGESPWTKDPKAYFIGPRKTSSEAKS
ncbi:hypothetical protein ACEQ8H_008510 [Pleosporales sp. CAS-2024a]